MIISLSYQESPANSGFKSYSKQENEACIILKDVPKTYTAQRIIEKLLLRRWNVALFSVERI